MLYAMLWFLPNMLSFHNIQIISQSKNKVSTVQILVGSSPFVPSTSIEKTFCNRIGIIRPSTYHNLLYFVALMWRVCGVGIMTSEPGGLKKGTRTRDSSEPNSDHLSKWSQFGSLRGLFLGFWVPLECVHTAKIGWKWPSVKTPFAA
jgi:hypothetical protein